MSTQENNYSQCLLTSLGLCPCFTSVPRAFVFPVLTWKLIYLLKKISIYVDIDIYIYTYRQTHNYLVMQRKSFSSICHTTRNGHTPFIYLSNTSVPIISTATNLIQVLLVFLPLSPPKHLYDSLSILSETQICLCHSPLFLA